MKTLRFLIMLCLCLLLAGCGGKKPAGQTTPGTVPGTASGTVKRPETLQRTEDAAAYESLLKRFNELVKLGQSAEKPNKELLALAEAEAELLAARVAAPYMREDGTVYLLCLNVNRGCYTLSDETGGKSEAEKLDTRLALQNAAFRLALLQAFNHSLIVKNHGAATYQNLLTPAGELSLISDYTDKAGKVLLPAGSSYRDAVAYFCDQKELYISVDDGEDGWFDRAAANHSLEQAEQELKGLVSWPVKLDVLYYGRNEEYAAEAEAFKASMESVLGSDRVVIRLIEVKDRAAYYDAGAHISSGAEADYDLIYGIGWNTGSVTGPEAYLEAFLPEGKGYLTRFIGLY